MKKPNNKLSKDVSKPWWLIDDEKSISYKVLKGFTNTFSHLPQPIKKKVFLSTSLFVVSISRLFFVISHFTLKGYKITGIEKHSGKKLTILYIGKKNPLKPMRRGRMPTPSGWPILSRRDGARYPIPIRPRMPACKGARKFIRIFASDATVPSVTEWGRPNPGYIRPRWISLFWRAARYQAASSTIR